MSESTSDLLTTLEALRIELRALTDRVAKIEASNGAASSTTLASQANGAAAPVDAPAVKAQPANVEQSGTKAQDAVTPEKPEVIPEEIMLVISAAVAAFLGERPRIRQVRLVSSRTWATQGRVSIQASHLLNR